MDVETASRVKLTEAQVREIRRRSLNEGTRALAREFGKARDNSERRPQEIVDTPNGGGTRPVTAATPDYVPPAFESEVAAEDASAELPADYTVPLNKGHDRCDRCGAQAYVRVHTVAGHDLLWCGHHYAHNEVALIPIIAYVHDERPALVAVETAYAAQR